MTDPTSTYDLDDVPQPDAIVDYRTEAAETDASVVVTFRTDDDTERSLVISPRGTCVVIEGGTTNDALPPDADPASVVKACRA